MSLQPNPQQPGGGYRLPAAAYFDQSWYEREQSSLFERTWIYAGEARDLPNAGSYLTRRIGNSPIMLVRNEQGHLGAFHNVCSHRGAMILEAEGTCSAIVCPYHRWAYNLSGALTNVPQQATQLPDLAYEAWGLQPVRFATWEGLIFVNIDGQAPPFDDWLAPLLVHLEGYRPASLSLLGEGCYEFSANWKFYIENHIDWYHLWYTHPTTLRDWDHHQGQMYQPGCHWASFEPPRSSEVTLGPSTMAPIDGLGGEQLLNGAHLIFPNLTLFTGPSYFALGFIEPLGPERARMHFRGLAAPNQPLTPEVRDAFVDAFREITEKEDASMTQRLQSTVRSRAWKVGPMTMEHEAPIPRFHEAYLSLFDT